MKVNRLCCKMAVIGIVSAVPSAVLAWGSMITGDALDGYVWLTGSDGYNQSSFTDGSRWSDETAPSSVSNNQKDYIVQEERNIRTPASADPSFNGRSLTIDNGRMYLKTNQSAPVDVTVGDLRLYGGAIQAADGGKTFNLLGRLTIMGRDGADDKSCMDVSANLGSRRINVVGDLAGAADARLRIRATSNDSPANGYGRVHIAPEGGANADWKGRFYVIGGGVEQAQKIVLSASSFAALGSRGANETAGGDDLITLENDGHFSADGGFNFTASKIKVITCGSIATDGAIGQDGYSLRFGDGARIVGNNASAILRVRDINGGVILFDDVSLSSLTLKVEGDNVRFGSGYNNPDVQIEINGSIAVEPGAVLGAITGSGTSVNTANGAVTLYGNGEPVRETFGERILKTAVGWYDASDSDAVELAEGTTNVKKLRNKSDSGSAYDLSEQGAAYPYSTLAADVVNGNSALVITNSQGYQMSGTLGWKAKTPRTLVMVSCADSVKWKEIKPDDWGSCPFYGLCVNVNGKSGAFSIERTQFGNGSGYWDSARGEYVKINGDFNLDDNVWETQVLWGDYADGTCTVGGYKYNSNTKATSRLEYTALSGDFGSGAGSKIKLNIGIDWGSHGYGNIGEAAVFDRVLSETELAEVNAYINRKWYGDGEYSYLYAMTVSALEMTDGTSLDITNTVATIGAISGMGTIAGTNALLTVSSFAPVCGDITVNAPVAEPVEGEYVTLRITINPANGDCGTLVVPAGYDLSKVDLVVSGCEHLTSADTFTVFQGKVGEALSRFHSVSSDSDCGLSLKYDSASGNVSGSLKKGMMIIIR